MRHIRRVGKTHAVRLRMRAAAVRAKSLSLRVIRAERPTRERREAPMRPRVREEGRVMTGTPAYKTSLPVVPASVT